MRFMIQRVTKAKVEIEEEIVGQIKQGYLVLIGISEEDTEEIADKMVRKMLALRLFEDENNKTNLSLSDVDGSLLLVSQFTLYASCKKGNRPSFTDAGSPQKAGQLYDHIIEKCREQTGIVETGRFGANMQITLTNDGPFTILLDSEDL